MRCDFTLHGLLYTGSREAFQTRMLIHAQGILTQLIFNHALRSRVKADAPAQGESGKPGLVNTKNATGKLFNLATSDINNIVEGREILQIGKESS